MLHFFTGIYSTGLEIIYSGQPASVQDGIQNKNILTHSIYTKTKVSK
uniref:Uncharacterized protein n=1 Tax=Anguilla anguilla TaxID=7936 RepID=A0A0E9WC22_ANGAN